VQSEAVGDAETQDEDLNGAQLHQLALAMDMMLSATFMGGGPTWTSSRGTRHRLDYVCIPQRWAAWVTHVEVPDDVVLSVADRDDHRLALRTPKGLDNKERRIVKDFAGRNAWKLPEVREQMRMR